MDQRLSLITLGVADLARARSFYVDGLGWTPSSYGNEAVAFFQLGGMVLALFGRDDLAADAGIEAGTGFGGVALAYNARDRAEVDRVLQEAVTAGASLLKAAEPTFWGGYAGYFADPDGHVFEVAHNPDWPLDAQGNVRLPA